MIRLPQDTMRAVILCSLLLSCSGMGISGGDRESMAAASGSFHQLLRWGEVDRAVGAHVSPGYGELFRARYRERNRGRIVTGLEIVSVVYTPQETTVTVDESFYFDVDTRLRVRRFVEKWKWDAGRWMLVEREVEVRVPATRSGAEIEQEKLIESGP
jgi:hypothetical protein